MYLRLYLHYIESTKRTHSFLVMTFAPPQLPPFGTDGLLFRLCKRALPTHTSLYRINTMFARNICFSGGGVCTPCAWNVHLYVERKAPIPICIYVRAGRSASDTGRRLSHSQIDRFRHKNKYYLLVIYLIREKIQH